MYSLTVLYSWITSFYFNRLSSWKSKNLFPPTCCLKLSINILSELFPRSYKLSFGISRWPLLAHCKSLAYRRISTIKVPLPTDIWLYFVYDYHCISLSPRRRHCVMLIQIRMSYLISRYLIRLTFPCTVPLMTLKVNMEFHIRNAYIKKIMIRKTNRPKCITLVVRNRNVLAHNLTHSVWEINIVLLCSFFLDS